MALVIGGAAATPAAAEEIDASSSPPGISQSAFPGIDCNPMASVVEGSAKTASGRAECVVPNGTTVGVTVVLYVDGANLGSTYRECTFTAPIDQVCDGYPVTSVVSGQACSRVGVTYTLPAPDGFQQRFSAVGNGCP
ncbi:hypothetical protein ACIQLJ_16640 [Microbacterium sp. NPDC091313]